MKFKGRFVEVKRDWYTNTPLLTFSLQDGQINEVNDIQDKDLTIEVKQFHKHRSLNMNAYMWELIGKIATHKDIKSTPQEIYEGFIQDMRIPYKDEDGYIIVTVKASVDMSKVSGHWCFYEMSSDGKFISYYMLRGSSTFDTSEMSKLIDLVVDEAKRLHIETETPEQIQKMKEVYKVEYEKRNIPYNG